MKKFTVLKEFSYNDHMYNEGDVAELVDHVVDNLGGRGYLEVYTDTPEPEKEESETFFKKKKRKNRSHSSG